MFDYQKFLGNQRDSDESELPAVREARDAWRVIKHKINSWRVIELKKLTRDAWILQKGELR